MSKAMLRYCKDAEGKTVLVPLDGTLGARVRQLASESNTTAASWAREALEAYIREHRSGREHVDPTRHDDRNPDYFDGMEYGL